MGKSGWSQIWYVGPPYCEDVPYCFWCPQGSPEVRYWQLLQIIQEAITSSGDVRHIWCFGTSSEWDRGIFSNKTVMWSQVKLGSKSTFLSITWDRNVGLSWKLHYCNRQVIPLRYDPWPQFDLWWPFLVFWFSVFLTSVSDVKGTFQYKKSMGWPPCDLRVRSYRRSKFWILYNFS